MIVYGTQTPKFTEWRSRQTHGKENGAYYYSKEIEENILSQIDSDAFVLTAGAILYDQREIPEGAIIVCHDNRTTKRSYGKLFNKKVTWVCSKQSTVEVLSEYGEHGVYVPLSIDTEYVKQFKRRKTKDTAYVGNAWSFKRDYLNNLPNNIMQLSNMNRERLLAEMAKYKHIIAEGRCLMEAQVLGAKTEVPIYDNDESVYVKALDNKDAIKYWREVIEENSTKGCILRVMKEFNDLREKKYRRHGDVFIASYDRSKELLTNKIKIVEEL